MRLISAGSLVRAQSGPVANVRMTNRQQPVGRHESPQPWYLDRALREQHGHTILNAWFNPEKLELGNAFGAKRGAACRSRFWRKAGSLTSAYRVEKNTTLVI